MELADTRVNEPGDPLCVTFRLSQAEYQSGVFRLSLGWPTRIIALVTVLAALVGIGYMVTGHWLGLGFFAAAVSNAAILSWALFLRPGSQYRRWPALRENVTYCFADDEVSWTFSTGASRVKWGYFVDLVETTEFFALRHQTKRLASIIPKRAFKSPDDIARFRQVARQLGGSPR